VIPNLKIDPQRLWDTLMHTAQFGATPKGGICRLTLTDLDRQVRDWFKAQCEALGCAVAIDEVGTMFARRPGKNPDLPPIAMGSHLDPQPTGGKFDGVLGVLGALEAMRTLHQAGYETNAPIEIVNWTNEEGARFAPAMLASGVFAGVFSPDYAYGRTDRDGKTFGDELQRIGYKADEKAGARKFSAMFELHIEQGPILEAEGRVIGAVQGVQGMRWYEVTVTGEESHTGTTPMPLRKNALVGAARMIDRIDAIAREHAPDALILLTPVPDPENYGVAELSQAPSGAIGSVVRLARDLGFTAEPQIPSDQAARIRAAFVKCEAPRDGMVRGKAHTMLNDGDMDQQRHIRGAVGAIVASVLNDTALFVSGGAEHQGPDTGGLIAVIAEKPGAGAELLVS